MNNLFPFIISFLFIALSELGDKTQVLVLSFSTKNKTSHILIGIAIGTLLSHGIAIILGSKICNYGDTNFIYYLKLLTYLTFLVFGILGFIKLIKTSTNLTKTDYKLKLLNYISSLFKNCIFIVALSIAIGEIGDKTWLASICLGIQYPMFKISLICGSICGMLLSNSIAIFFGKWLSHKISDKYIDILSNSIFIIFGFLGLINIFLNYK